MLLGLSVLICYMGLLGSPNVTKYMKMLKTKILKEKKGKSPLKI